MSEKEVYENDEACRNCPEVLTCESTDCPKRFVSSPPALSDEEIRETETQKIQELFCKW